MVFVEGLIDLGVMRWGLGGGGAGEWWDLIYFQSFRSVSMIKVVLDYWDGVR